MALVDSALTDTIIKSFYTVYNRLGFGFLEKVYENALVHELTKQGLSIQQQVPIDVYYDGVIVGKYFADILVEDRVILELKAAKEIDDANLAQLTNYLKATKYEVGFVMNFGPEPKFKRRIFSNK